MTQRQSIDRVRRVRKFRALFDEEYSYFCIFFLVILILLFSSIGFLLQNSQLEMASPQRLNASEILFHAVQLIALETSFELPDNVFLFVARILVILLYVVLSYKVLSFVLGNAFGALRLRRLQGHVVLCGLGRIGSQLVEELCKRNGFGPHKVVVIESNSLNTHIPLCKELGVLLIEGDATQSEILRKAKAHKARHVFAVSGDDALNMEILANLVNQSDESNGEGLECHCHLADLRMAELLRRSLNTSSQANTIKFNFQSIYTNSARLLLRERLAVESAPETDEVAHYFVIGFEEMGQTFALQAALLGHYKNLKRLRMTLLDNDLAGKRDRFLSKHPRFCPNPDAFSLTEPFTDDWNDPEKLARPAGKRYHSNENIAIEYVCNAEFMELPPDIDDDSIVELLESRIKLNSEKIRPCLVICKEDDKENLAMGVHLSLKLKDRLKTHIPIYIWLPEQTASAKMLTGTSGGGAQHLDSQTPTLVPFGERIRSCGFHEMVRSDLETIARGLHEVFRKQWPLEEWERTSEINRDSNRLAAAHIDMKLAAIGCVRTLDWKDVEGEVVCDFGPEELKLMAQMEHYRWVAEKLLSGFQYGHDRKNFERDQICAWKHIKESEQEKDYVLIKAIPYLIKSLEPPETIVRRR